MFWHILGIVAIATIVQAYILGRQFKDSKRDYCTASPENIGVIELGKDCCRQHDKDYTGSWQLKLIGDLKLLKCGATKGLWHLVSSIGLLLYIVPVFLAVSTVGWYYWFKTEKKDDKEK